MYWFWDLYSSPADRGDPRASPLRGKLAGLPPAFVVTCEFDPLRDEGIAYAEALTAAGVPAEQLQARGHFHSSFTMVDVVITGVSGRARMAQALRRFAGLPQETEQETEQETGRGKAGVRPVGNVPPREINAAAE
jgi:acetyl esterase/lipase